MLVTLSSSNALGKQRSSIDGLVHRFVEGSWHHAVAPLSEHHGLMVNVRVRPGPILHAKQSLTHVLVDRLHGMLRHKQGVHKLEMLRAVTPATPKELREDARNAGYTRLLNIEIFVERNHVHLTGQHYEIRKNLWERLRSPEGGARGHYFATARIDAELRALLARPPIRQGQPRFQWDSVPIQSADAFIGGALGDIDADGFDEIVLVTEKDVQVFRWLPTGEPTHVTTFSMKDSPRRTRRSRGRFAHVLTADVTGDRQQEIAIWTSDLAHGLILSWNDETLIPLQLKTPSFACGYGSKRSTVAQLCGPPLMVEPRLDGQAGEQILQGEVAWGRNTLKPRISTWTTKGGGTYHPWESVHWNLFGGSYVKADGQRRMLRATVGPKNQITVRTSGHHWTLKAGNGVAATVADLNDDGEPELIRTTNAKQGEGDAIVIHQLSMSTHEPPEIWRFSNPKRAVVSLSTGDMDNNGFVDILALQGGLPYRLAETHPL